MTPEQKAKELVDDYMKLFSVTLENSIHISEAKACARYTVAEIQEVIDANWDEVQNMDRAHAWWNKVEEEIDKLQ